MKTLAIIPARGGSKRLPGKNTRSFLGVPLIGWTIRFARKLDRFDKIIVSTDAEEIASVSRLEGIEVPRLRPANLATDVATSVDVVLDVLENEQESGLTYDSVALLQPTSPIREASRWQEALEHIVNGGREAVIGVKPVHTHPFHIFALQEGKVLRSIGDSAGLGVRSQDLPLAVGVAGNMYLILTSVLQKHRSFFPPGAVGVLCDQPCEVFDIDTEADWIAAEALARHFEKSP